MKKTVLFIVSVLLALLVHVSAAAAAPDPSISQLEARGFDLADLKEAIATKQRHAKRLLGEGGIVGMGAGIRADGRAVVKIYAESFAASDVPPSLDGVPVEVEVTGRVVAQVDTTARFPRPVPTGVSVGHPDITAGTIGARVTDGTDFFLLSNNHVIANVNNALLGDEIVQPGALDGGLVPADTIATLEDFEPIDFSGGPNTLDAAIARTTTSDLGYATPTDGYGAPAAATTSAGVGLPVKKYGRTTGLTTGTIDAVNVTVDVCYVAFLWICLQEARFVNQIAIVGDAGDFSAGGDSGSLVVTSIGNQPVGLLFAGGGGVTFANQIDLVLSRFGVSVDDGSASGGNEAPAAADDGYPMAEDTTLDEAAPGVLGNDDPVDGDSLTASLVSGPSNAASFTLNTDGSFSYSPTANYNGPDSFVYRASDGNGGSDTATVNLTVDPVNDAPYADAGADQTVTAGDTAQLDGSGSGDIDGDSYSYSWNLSTPSGSSATLDNPSAESPSFVTDVEGDYVATLTVDDGNATDQDSVTVTASQPNLPPVAVGDSYSTPEDATLSVSTALGVLGNDDPVDGDSLTASLVSGPSNAASFTLNTDGSFSYSPTANYNGPDSFVYRASDGNGGSDTATVNLTVDPVNDAPYADAGADQTVTAGDTAQLDGSGSGDIDGDSYSYSWNLSTPSGSSATLDNPSAESPSFVTDVEGDYVATLTVDDGNATDQDSVTVTAVRPNQAPKANNDFYSVDEDAALSMSAPGILDNDDPMDGDPLTAVLNSGPSHASSFSLNPDGSFDYVPAPDFSGSDNFTYYADDGLATDLALVNIGVNDMNDDPVAVADSYSADAGVPLSVAAPGVLDNDSDVDDATLTAVLVSGPTHAASFVLNADGSFDYTSEPGFDDDDTFTYRASDGRGGEATATVTISVAGSPPPPPSTQFYFSLSNNGSVGGLSVANEDIVAFDGTEFALHFDGSDVGLGGLRIDGFDVISATEILMSFTAAGTVGGVSMEDSDVVKFTATQLGVNTAGSFELYFDGSDVGLTSSGEDVDGVELLSDGTLLVSTNGSLSVPGASGKDEDLLAFAPTSLGSTTAGSWSIYFDGSDVQLSDGGGEDVDAVAVDGSGHIHLSTRGSFFVAGVSGADDDVFAFVPSSLGSSTSGAYAAPLYFDGSAYGLAGNDVFGLDFP